MVGYDRRGVSRDDDDDDDDLTKMICHGKKSC